MHMPPSSASQDYVLKTGAAAKEQADIAAATLLDFAGVSSQLLKEEANPILHARK